jgi:hypothetical protein
MIDAAEDTEYYIFFPISEMQPCKDVRENIRREFAAHAQTSDGDCHLAERRHNYRENWLTFTN